MTSVSILKSRHQAQKLLSKQFPVVAWCSVTSNTLKKFTTERRYSLLRLRINVQVHTTCYISTYHMMTEDYRGCTRGQVCGDSPCTNDENPEGCLPRSSNNTQICKAFGQEGPSRFFCLTGTRDNLQPRECGGHPMLETYFQKLMDKVIAPCRATSGSVGYDLFMPIDFVLQPHH